MYRHNKYEDVNAEQEIDKLTEIIRQLVMSNNENISFLKDFEDMKTNNINLKQRLDKTEANICEKEDEITNLLEKVDILKTESQDNTIFVQDAIELFKIDNFHEECD